MRSTKAIATRITQAIHRDQAPADVAVNPGMVARLYVGDWCSDMAPDARAQVTAAVTANMAREQYACPHCGDASPGTRETNGGTGPDLTYLCLAPMPAEGNAFGGEDDRDICGMQWDRIDYSADGTPRTRRPVNHLYD